MRAWVLGLVLFTLAVAPGEAAQKQRQDAFCHNQYLTRQQQSTCVDQVAGVETIDELKRLQARYRDKIKRAQEAQKK